MRRRQALYGRTKQYGADDPDTLTSLGNLALILRSQGDYETAEEYLVRAIEGKSRNPGLNHPDTLTNLDNLSLVLRDRKRLAEAEEKSQECMNGIKNEVSSLCSQEGNLQGHTRTRHLDFIL